MDKIIKAGVVGGSGFTGLELIKILSRHNYVKLNFVTSRTYKNRAVSEAFPSYYDNNNSGPIFVENVKESSLKETDIIFLCLPPGSSMEYLKGIYGKYKFKVIDVGSDFRLENACDYSYWYKAEHIMKDTLSEFVYGLPEINKNKIKKSNFIANPGCYPTSVLLALAPVLNGGISIKNINIDSKSGLSGAGRKLAEKYLFTNIENNFYAYSTAGHRHTGEIEQEIKNISGKKFKVCFTPHLIPISRGIFTSVYCKVIKSGSGSGLEKKINLLYEKFSKDNPFFKFAGNTVPQIKDVVGTNMCITGYSLDKRTEMLKIFSVIDNLLKGAAGQAVQNMNIMMGFDEKEGLNFNGLYS